MCHGLDKEATNQPILRWYHQPLQKLLSLHRSIAAPLRTDLLLDAEEAIGKLESFFPKLRISKSPHQGCFFQCARTCEALSIKAGFLPREVQRTQMTSAIAARHG